MLGAAAILLATINIAGGFLVTQRMLQMFRQVDAMTIAACLRPSSPIAYLAAGLLFIFSLGGLSAQESARRGNLFGIVGMLIAVAGHRVRPARRRATPC